MASGEASNLQLAQFMDYRFRQMMHFFQVHLSAVDRRIDEKIDQIGNNMRTIASDVKRIDENMRNEQNNIKDLREDVDIIWQRVNTIEQAVENSEKEAVRCNLKFFGVPDSPRFNSSLVDQMVELLNTYSVPDHSFGRQWVRDDVERAFRVSTGDNRDNRDANRARPVIVRFKNFSDKMEILRDRDMREAMREDNIRVTSDLTSHQRSILQFYKSEGKIAYYIGGRLHISEQYDAYDDQEFPELQPSAPRRGQGRDQSRPDHRFHERQGRQREDRGHRYQGEVRHEPRTFSSSRKWENGSTYNRPYRTIAADSNSQRKDYDQRGPAVDRSRERRDGRRPNGNNFRIRVEGRSREVTRTSHHEPPVVPGEQRYSDVVANKRATSGRAALYRRAEETRRNIDRACGPSESEDSEPLFEGLPVPVPEPPSPRAWQGGGLTGAANSTFTVTGGPVHEGGAEQDADDEQDGEDEPDDDHYDDEGSELDDDDAEDDEASSGHPSDDSDAEHGEQAAPFQPLAQADQARGAPSSGPEGGAQGAVAAGPVGAPLPPRQPEADSGRQAAAETVAAADRSSASAAADSRPRTRSVSARRADDPGGRPVNAPLTRAGVRDRGQCSIKDAFLAQSGEGTANKDNSRGSQPEAARKDP